MIKLKQKKNNFDFEKKDENDNLRLIKKIDVKIEN